MIDKTESKIVKYKVKEILKNKDVINITVKNILDLKKFMDEDIRKKILKIVLVEGNEYYKGDDLVLFKDTLKRNYEIEL